MTIPQLIIREIASRQIKKQALRITQRKVGVNKAMSLVRRFDKRKTFVKNLNKDPRKMLVKMFKELLIRKTLKILVPARYVKNWIKYGTRECMKRLVIKATPQEIRRPFYFIKGCRDQYEKVAVIAHGKKCFWEELAKIDQRQQAKVLDTIIKFNPRNKELKEYWYEVLDNWYLFKVNSPMTGNFSQHYAEYNVSQNRLILAIRGYGKEQRVEFYGFDAIPWEYILKAMKGADFGKEIYSRIRSPYSIQLARYWAALDPHYHK